jgi:hypothetical protein
MAFRPCAFAYAVSGGRPWPALTDGGPTLQSGAGAPLPSRHDAGWVAPVALSPSWVPALLTPSSLLRALFSGRCSAPQPVASRPAWSNPGGPRSGRSPCMLLGLSWLPARSHFHRPRVAYSGRTLFAAHLPIVEAGKTTCRVPLRQADLVRTCHGGTALVPSPGRLDRLLVALPFPYLNVGRGVGDPARAAFGLLVLAARPRAGRWRTRASCPESCRQPDHRVTRVARNCRDRFEHV